MRNLIFRTFNTLLLFTLLASVCYSQTIQSVDYFLEYDDENCWYDFNIIIQDGFAEGAGQRTQFNSQITLIVPTGSTPAIVQRYLPLQNNQTYNGTEPMEWGFGPQVNDPEALPNYNFVSITPTLSPTSQYNNIYAGDTLKLFSVTVTGASNCNEGVRLYENGVDPSSSDPGMGGADFSNGFTVGGFAQIYNENAPYVLPQPPTIIELVDNSDTDINIKFETEGTLCQGSIEYLWSGPNGYTSTTKDVFISPALPANYGDYEVIFKDSIGCADTTIIKISGGAPEVNDLMIGDLILNPTFEHISAHLNIVGDDNHNSTFVYEYKLTGTDIYSNAAQSMRAFPEMIVDGATLDENFHAGTAMFLQPNSSYDLRITVLDPDGGGMVFNETISTNRIPTYPQTPSTIFVVPGNGGGSGTIGNPYQGIQSAVDNASPGDVIEVADGTYTPFTMMNGGIVDLPIVLKSTNLHGAVIDGSNTSTGIMTIGSFSDSIQYIIIDGFEIKNGKWAIDAQNTQHLTIKNNKINDVDFGFYNRRENGWEHDQYITNNEIIGRTPWPQASDQIPPERGIDIRGNRNVISYNTISDFGDGISTDGAPYRVSYALDIHHNFINRIVDDLIEVDGVLSNVRVYRNKGFNGRMGVSLAPIFGGPAYVFRNEFFNLHKSTFKMNRSPAGLYIVHNSVSKKGRGLTSDAGWQNTVFMNNAVVSKNYCFEEFGLIGSSSDLWNYNGYNSSQTGTNGSPWFKWDNVQYINIASLNSSGLLGQNSLGIELSDFETLTIPQAYSTEAFPVNVDFVPSNGSDLIDNGTTLDNLQSIYVTDGSPDIGAYEKGEPMPECGHDFDNLCEREDLSLRTWNGDVNNAWYEPRNWTPCGVPEEITDVIIPGGRSNYPFVNTDVIINNLSVLGNGAVEVKGTSTIIKLKGE